ncbi:MAG: magnesium transporter [Bacteroidetes bacterium]|nr:magnesium transporter [Bacteroidota bacterium]MBS1630683.1 magnesium transporter [Bacteroidota bacterium]
MNLREIRNRIRAGEVRALFARNEAPHPAPQLHAVDKAELINSLGPDEILPAFAALGDEQLEVFPYLDLERQKELIDRLPRGRVSHILNSLSSDDRTALFASFDEEELPRYLALLNAENESTTNDLLEYPEGSVAMLVDTGYATVLEDMSIADAMLHLRRNLKDNEAADVFFVVDHEGHLLDDIPVRRLVLSEPDLSIREIMDGFFVSLKITDTKEEAIACFKQYDRVVLPVVDEQNKMRGVITIDDVLDVAEERDTREMQRFGGLESLDYPYVETPFFTLIRKRAGWLVILFLSEMLTASAMGYFSHEIEKAVVLALFVPLVISSGGNSGSQAATLIIRAMALKELSIRDWWYVMRREILSGLSLGVVLGSLGFVRISAWQGLHWIDYGPHWALLGATVACSLIGIVMWGTLSGSMIPILLKKFGLDPATSSAPFVATLVDVTGLVIYFSIAATILSGTLL